MNRIANALGAAPNLNRMIEMIEIVARIRDARLGLPVVSRCIVAAFSARARARARGTIIVSLVLEHRGNPILGRLFTLKSPCCILPRASRAISPRITVISHPGRHVSLFAPPPLYHVYACVLAIALSPLSVRLARVDKLPTLYV